MGSLTVSGINCSPIKNNYEKPNQNTTNSSQPTPKNKQLISFGYNKSLDKYIKSANTSSQAVIDLNNYCNTFENNVRNLEKAKGSEYDSTAIVKQYIIPAKIILSRLVETGFPDLNYTAREAQSYLDEIQRNTAGSEWKKEIYNALLGKTTVNSDGTNSVQKSSNTALARTNTTNQPDNADKTTKKLAEPQTATSQTQKVSGMLEEFVPGKSNPKGFQDVGGMFEVKDKFRKWIIDPQDPVIAKKRAEFGDLLHYPNGILLYGPPGCGKTFIVEALATESGLPLYKLALSKIGSKYIHETSNNIKQVFEEINAKAQASGKPCLLFLDEIDSLIQSRKGMSGDRDYKREEINTLLQEINNSSSRNVIVIGATNDMSCLDGAGIRTGRFDEKIFIGLPDVYTRKQVLEVALSVGGSRSKQILKSDDCLTRVAESMEGFSNSDIRKVIKDAAEYALEEDIPLNMKAFEYAIQQNEKLKKDPADFKDPIAEDSPKAKKVWAFDLCKKSAKSNAVSK